VPPDVGPDDPPVDQHPEGDEPVHDEQVQDEPVLPGLADDRPVVSELIDDDADDHEAVDDDAWGWDELGLDELGWDELGWDELVDEERLEPEPEPEAVELSLARLCRALAGLGGIGDAIEPREQVEPDEAVDRGRWWAGPADLVLQQGARPVGIWVGANRS
jgi:hypothetical protein